jgi:uncharacterized alkaline shock family protein YloU
MHKTQLQKYETIRALREIILTIVQTNLQETNEIEANNKMTERLFTSFKKSVFSSNGIQVGISEELIIVKISVNIYEKTTSIVNLISKLQQRIYDDVKELTGCMVHQIFIKVNKIISSYE